MNKYTFSCSCGDKVTVEAMSKDEAVDMIMAKMEENGGMEAHMTEKHAGEPVPSMEEAKMMVMEHTEEDTEMM